MRAQSQKLFSGFVFLCAMFVLAGLSAAQLQTEGFDGSGTLDSDPNWVASSQLIKDSGVLHNDVPEAAWRYAVYTALSNVNRVMLRWDDVAGTDVTSGGVQLVTSSNLSGNGYFIYFRSGTWRVWEIVGGVLNGGSPLVTRSGTAPSPGDLMRVDHDAGTFTVYLNDNQVAEMTISGTPYNVSYGGIVLYANASNDVESFAVEVADLSGGGGGGGGGGTPGGGGVVGDVSGVRDNFDTSDNMSWDYDKEQIVQNGDLVVNTGSGEGWGHLGVFQRQGAVGATINFSPTTSQKLGGEYIPGGVAILLDGPTEDASGFMVMKRSTILVYRIQGGIIPTGDPQSFPASGAANPAPGDSLRVMVSEGSEGTKNVQVFVNGALDASFALNSETLVEDSYIGVMQYSKNPSYTNVAGITAFTAYYERGEAENIELISGNNQSAPIQTTLPETLRVKVTDETGAAVPNWTVDFNIASPEGSDASLLQIDYDGRIWVEAERGRLYNKAYLESDANASGGSFVTTPYEGGQRGTRVVSIPFYVPQPGVYAARVRYRAINDSQNSYHVSFDGADSVAGEFNVTSSWAWHRTPAQAQLSKGQHTLNIIIYDPGFDLDKVFIFDRNIGNNDSYVPSGFGETGPDLPNITDDNGLAYTTVTFGTNADDNVIVHAQSFKSDGVTPLLGSPIEFNLDPLPGPAAKLTQDAGMVEQPGFPGQPVSLEINVEDNFGNGVQGQSVNWAITQGAGAQLSRTSSTSNIDGVASVTLTLGLVDTLYKVEASAPLQGSPKVFTVRVGERPSNIDYVSGNDQTGDAGEPLPQPLVVKVTKEDGSPFSNFPVTFQVLQGGGAVRQGSGTGETQLAVNSDVNGEARVTWILGGDVGANQLEARAPGLVGSPITFNATGVTGPPTKFVIVSGNNQEGPIGLDLLQPFVVKVSDAHDNPVDGVKVTFNILEGTNAYFKGTENLTQQNVFTGTDGLAQTTLVMGTVVNQRHRVQATAENVPAAPLEFVADSRGAIASEIQYIGGDRQSAVVTNALPQPLIVLVKGPDGSPISGHPVKFVVTKGGGNIGGTVEKTVQSDESGFAQAALTLGTAAGDTVHVVEARSFREDKPDVPLANSPVVFKATGQAKPAAQLVKVTETDNQGGPAGLVLEKPIQVRVTDIHNNNIPDYFVTFEVQGGGGTIIDGSNEVTFKRVQTGADGIAAVSWKMPEVRGTWQMIATAIKEGAGGQPLSNSPMFFTANSTEGNAETLTIVSQDSVEGVVDQVLPTPVQVKVTDRFDNPVGGYNIQFRVTEGGGNVNGEDYVNVQTDPTSGIAQVEWRLGTESGYLNNLLEARAAGLEGGVYTFKATALADDPHRLIETPAANNQIGQVGEPLPEPIKVRIVDQFGNGIPAFPVTFTVMGIDSLKGHIDGSPEAVIQTDVDGYAQVSWVLGKQPGSKNNELRVSARFNNKNLINSPFTFFASTTVGNPAILHKMTDDTNLSGIIGGPIADDLKVRVTDKHDNPIANHEVTFEVLSVQEADGGSLDGPTDVQKTKRTDSNGLVRVQFWCGNRAGAKINRVSARAEYQGTDLDNSPVMFYISAQSTNADSIKMVDGNSQQGVVGQYLSRDLQVEVVDEFGNRITAPQPVQFRVIAGQGYLGNVEDSLRIVTVNSDRGGIAKVRWVLGTTAGQNVVEVISTNGTTSLGTLRFTATGIPDITDAERSGIDIYPAAPVKVSLGNEPDKLAQVVVKLRDKYDNPVVGKAVILEQPSGQGISISQPTGLSDVNGEVAGKVSSTSAGVMKLWARDMNSRVTIADTALITFEALAAYRVDKAPGNNGDQQTRNVGTVLPNPLRVVVLDRFDNPIYDKQIEFRVKQGNGTLVGGAYAKTDSQGVAEKFYQLGPDPGTQVNIVEAHSEGLLNSPVTFTEIGLKAAPARLELVSGDAQSAPPGQSLPNPLKVRVVDNNGWAIQGAAVQFDVLVNTGHITGQSQVQSNEYGIAQVSAQTGTNMGNNLFRAFLKNYQSIPSVTFSANTISGNASQLAILSGNLQNGTVGKTLFNALTVQTRDDYGNPVPNVTVSFNVMSQDAEIKGSGTLSNGQKMMTVKSDAQGRASVFYTLGNVAGLNRVVASAAGLQPDQLEFDVYGQPDYPFTMEIHSGNNQHGEMGQELVEPIRVIFRDQFGNPAPNGSVTFAVLTGGGSILESQPVSSRDNGVASVHWRLGAAPITKNQVIASSSLPGGTFQLIFDAMGDNNRYPNFVNLPDELHGSEGSLISFDFTVSDQDGDDMTVIESSMPEGATFEAISATYYQFSWTPAEDQGGTYYPIFVVTDVRGGRDIDSVKIIVDNIAIPPQISSHSPSNSYVELDQNELYSFNVQATDPDNPNGDLYYTWRINGNPVNAYQKSFTLDTGVYSSGTFNVQVTVQDNDGASTSFTWTVKIKTVSVELSGFTSKAEPYQGIILDWQTAKEVDNAGFHILKSRTQEGGYETITKELIAPDMSREYRYIDDTAKAGVPFYYKLEAVDLNGRTQVFGPVKAMAPVPSEYELSQNYPNPFNPTTSVRYQLPKAGRVVLQVFNINGQLVRTLVDNHRDAGYHVAIWDGTSSRGMLVSSGVYYYRITVGDYTMTKKMALLK